MARLLILFLVLRANVIFGLDCATKDNCSKCIQSTGCAWCSKTPEANNTALCFKEGSLKCPVEVLFNPKSKIEVIDDKTLTDKEGDAVQIQPQKIKLKLRLEEEAKIEFYYRQAVDYPLDLYYLMDLSYSMLDDKEKLSSLGDLLTSTMKNITNNFKLGFGGFVEKPTKPYFDEENECENCQNSYVFKNYMPLTLNTKEFSEKVNNTKVSTNEDSPEAGLDAIVQSITCVDQIGWRKKARKMLVLSTDEAYHIAGDGRLGGIVQPNDLKCHLDSQGAYTHDLINDYPSISQIRKITRENNVYIIFAVTEKLAEIYKALSREIPGSSHGTLTDDSSNIVELVQSKYKEMMNSVTLIDNSTNWLDIKYRSDCAKGEMLPAKECKDLMGRPLIKFEATFKLMKCPEEADLKQTIEIKPINLVDSLLVEVEALCKCSCEKKGNPGFVEDAEACGKMGNEQCGICACKSNRFGRSCQCDGSELRNDPESKKGCPSKSGRVCSGMGSCICNKCECNKRRNPRELIYGSACECDNYSCPRSSTGLCSGIDNGRCECGKCVCTSGWSGTNCGCSTLVEPCKNPETDLVCSGHGTCECGACKCGTDGKNRYSGKYCQNCPLCSGTRCVELLPCVECKVHKTGNHTKEECSSKCQYKLETFETIAIDNQTTNVESMCQLPKDDDCTIIFKYIEGKNGHLQIHAQKELKCLPKPNFTAITFGVIGATVVIGLLSLIAWRISVEIHDRREFARFERERAAATFQDDNPLYAPTKTDLKSPTFRELSKRE